MATTTKGLKGWKSTGNPLMDALMIMSLAPVPGGMAIEDEKVAGDLASIFNKIKPFKSGGETAAAEVLPEASVGNIEKILKEDPKAARGANVPKDPGERARLIQEFLAKQKGQPPAPVTPPSQPTMALEQLSAPSPAKAARAAKAPTKVAGGKPSPISMSKSQMGFAQGVTEAQRQDLLQPMNELKQLYQYLRLKLPDTGRRAYGWDKKIQMIDEDIKKFLEPQIFQQLTTDPTPQSMEFLRDLRFRYEDALEKANQTLQGLIGKRS